MLSDQIQSKNFQAIIFDCDGTLVQSERPHFLAWKNAFKKYDFELTEEQYIHRFMGVCDKAILNAAQEWIGQRCGDRIMREMLEHYHALQTIDILPVKPTVAFLKQLISEKENRGLKLAVASGARKQEIMRNLKSLSVEDQFDAIVSGVDDLANYNDPQGTNKPRPYVYLETAKRLRIDPQQCIAIEDSAPGVSAAVAAGCLTIAIPNEYTKRQNLSHAHFVVETLAGYSIDHFLLTFRTSAMASMGIEPSYK